MSWRRRARQHGPLLTVIACYITIDCAGAELQRRIVGRMRRLGMTPVFPAFAGLVPDALVARYPQVQPPVQTNAEKPSDTGYAVLHRPSRSRPSYVWVMAARFPVQARYKRLGPWAGFPEGLTSTYMLDPSDPLFTDIGAAFVQVWALNYSSRLYMEKALQLLGLLNS